MSQDDVKRINDELKSINRAILQQQEENLKMASEIGAEEMSMEKRRTKIDASCNTFNRVGASMEIIPITAKNSCNIDYTLVAKSSAAENQRFSSEIKVRSRGRGRWSRFNESIIYCFDSFK